MKVILLADVQGIGKKGEVVEVKQGYANNYLLRQKLALEATNENLNVVKTKAKAEAAKAAQVLAEAQSDAAKLKNKEIKLAVKCGNGGRLYGKVTTMDIAKELKKRGFNIDKRHISLAEDIKSIGKFTAALRLHPEVQTEIFVVTEEA